MEKNIENFDFHACGQAIREARDAKGWTRDQLGAMAGISGRCLVDIENDGQAPSLHILSSIFRILDVSLDQFIFPDRKIEKDTERRQLDTLLDGMDSRDLTILTATAKGILEAKTK